MKTYLSKPIKNLHFFSREKIQKFLTSKSFLQPSGTLTENKKLKMQTLCDQKNFSPGK